MPPLNPARSELWKSLEELDDDPERLRLFSETLAQEFPRGASVWNELKDPLSRRNFLQIMGASAALAGLSACTKMPPEKIISYVVAPEKVIPGNPSFFATSGSFGGYAKGLLVESHEGRPTKIEGNPRHPSNLGKSDIFMQAELLQLYDPDRAQAVKHLGEISGWDAFDSTLSAEAAKWRIRQGEGLRILSNHITSPTLLDDIATFLRLYPKAQWHAYEPVNDDLTREATRLVFGKELRPLYDFTKAQVVASLDSDFLGAGPSQEVYARDFMSFRKSISNSDDLNPRFNRLYVIESSISTTGACADHRLALKPSAIREAALELAFLLRVPGFENAPAKAISKHLSAIAADLQEHAGQCLVLAGEQQPPAVQAIAFAINQTLGNFGKSIRFLSSDGADRKGHTTPAPGSLSVLTQDMDQGSVNALIILGGNPVYDTPATLRFQDRLERVALRIRLGQYEDETSYDCHWHLPESHFLESWGDGKSVDGTLTLQQPLISPLYETRSAIELFSLLNGQAGRSAHQAVKDYWRQERGQEHAPGTYDAFFDQALCNGFLPEKAPPPVPATCRIGWQTTLPPPPTLAETDLEAVIKPDPTIWDGRYANNAWLQELPKPLLQLTWSNAVVLSPVTSAKLQLGDEDEVELKVDGHTERAAVLRVPGHPDGSATLYLGYGRSRAGRVGNLHGYNAYRLQDHRSPGWIPALQMRKLGGKSLLATTHSHSSMEGRDLVVHAGVDQFKRDPNSVVKDEFKSKQPSLLPDYKSPMNASMNTLGEAWAMVIDLTSCIGCNACTIACQAENNIPVVGKDQVRRAREMHWIRVDRYYQGDPSSPETFFQPVPCMHCEKAPCEEVCPTAATNHSPDGINQMVYNRCVGTRYCSNNCPYKVRRFNFFQYSDIKTASLQLMHNPDVTVRSRGVMEKCTYCIQRIQAGRIAAEREDRPLRDAEILTACQQTCPTEAIVFGDQNDPTSRVAKLKLRPHGYKLLNDLGTKPRTTYLALIRNPNPKMVPHVDEPSS